MQDLLILIEHLKVQKFLKGLYPDAVVPVHSVPTEEDFLLLGSRLCSKMDKRRQNSIGKSSSSKYSTISTGTSAYRGSNMYQCLISRLQIQY